jgi:hypothetical protein
VSLLPPSQRFHNFTWPICRPSILQAAWVVLFRCPVGRGREPVTEERISHRILVSLITKALITSRGLLGQENLGTWKNHKGTLAIVMCSVTAPNVLSDPTNRLRNSTPLIDNRLLFVVFVRFVPAWVTSPASDDWYVLPNCTWAYWLRWLVAHPTSRLPVGNEFLDWEKKNLPKHMCNAWPYRGRSGTSIHFRTHVHIN